MGGKRCFGASGQTSLTASFAGTQLTSSGLISATAIRSTPALSGFVFSLEQLNRKHGHN